MTSLKQLKFEQKTDAQHHLVILELNAIVKDIERSEKLIQALNKELETVNARYQGPRTTREDVAYLASLLECAKRKLAWEKQINSLQKRTPSLMEKMAAILNDPKGPPPQQVQEQLMQALKAIQSTMERLQAANTGQCGAKPGEASEI
jgi:vacuolar-type H+-ATPase subunit I/STV1